VQSPKKKVVLITFNNEVNIVGDGASTGKVVAGDRLGDFEDLLQIGRDLEIDSLRSIEQSIDDVSKKVAELQETGATALGPALLLAVAIASQSKRSEVIICTDGLSNVGVGSLEGDKEKGGQFYTRVGELAKANDTTINVLSIEGSDCAMDCLSRCAEMTSGTINIVNPLELVRQIRLISQNPVIATNVKVKLLTHRQLGWLALPSKKTKTGKKKKETKVSSFEYEVGNAMANTDLSFGYKASQVNAKVVPFQAQVYYTRKDGMQCMRVISTTKRVTENRAKTESTADVAVLAVAAVQRAARQAQVGRFKEARMGLFAVERLIKRASKTDAQMEEHANFIAIADQLDYELRLCLQRAGSSSCSSSRKGKEKDDALEGLGDTTAKTLFKMRTASKTEFLSGGRKKAVIDSRLNNDATLRDMYYATKF